MRRRYIAFSSAKIPEGCCRRTYLAAGESG